MKVLVTGGSGFIGSHVVDKLKDKGVNVRVFDAIAPTYRKDIEYYQGSILDINALGFAMSGIDAVMHLAAIADVKDVFDDPYYAESINVRGTINVLEAARRAGIKRVIYGSTTWVYSEAGEDKVDETTPLRAPAHLYTATKLAGEYYCQTYSKLYYYIKVWHTLWPKGARRRCHTYIRKKSIKWRVPYDCRRGPAVQEVYLCGRPGRRECPGIKGDCKE
jgi:UDP-glucose 4-epimerase